MKRPYIRPRRSGETIAFSTALHRLRQQQKWTQPQLGARLGVSIRTLTNWECGYWLPHFKQRLHVVLSLRNAPPENVLEVADALGVSGDPLVAPLLQQFRDALDPPEEETTEAAVPVEPLAPPAPPPPPPPPRPTVSDVRAVVDPVVLDAANALDARPNDVRAIVARIVAACRGMGGALEELEGAVAPVVPKGKG